MYPFIRNMYLMIKIYVIIPVIKKKKILGVSHDIDML